MNSQREREIEILFESVPRAVRKVVRVFYDLPLLSKIELMSLLEQYAIRIQNAAEYRGDVDARLADCISLCCTRLLREQWDDEALESKRLIQAACLYYVEIDDGDGDMASAYGLDDDAKLLNFVVEHLGRPDLTIRI
jgi:hypothetical protein